MNEISNIDLLWTVVSAFLVFLMQLGFSMLETGMVRVKNTIITPLKNKLNNQAAA